MEEKNIMAYFATEDDAYSASIHLRAMEGVRDISTDSMPDQDDGQSQMLLPFLPMQGQSISGTGLGVPSIGYLFNNDADEEEGDLIGRRRSRGRRNVMLTCTVDESKLHEVIEAIIQSGGSVEVV